MADDRTELVPPGWGDDYLTEFLENADHNRLATFVHMPAEYEKLRLIDDLFMKPSVTVWRVRDEESFRASLFHRAHGFYRAACGAAMAGQIPEAFSMCRAVLESAAYALHMAKTTGLDEVWFNRHQADGITEVRKQFTMKAIRNTIAAFNKETDARFERLYQEAIDMGAHPNERSVSTSMEITKKGEEHAIRNLLLNPGGLSQQYAMMAVARSGACALEMLLEVFANRSQELGLLDDWKAACKGL